MGTVCDFTLPLWATLLTLSEGHTEVFQLLWKKANNTDMQINTA